MSILQHRLVRVAAAVAVIGWGAVLVAPTGASAAFVANSDTGLTSPDVSIDFGSNLFADGTVITNQFEVSDGVIFGATYQYGTAPNLGGSISGGVLGTVAATFTPGSIFFTSAVSEAVFSWRTNPGTTTFEALLNLASVESFTAATNADISAAGKFYGFGGILFDEIRLTINLADTAFTLDNLQYNLTAVPLPAALPLFLSALAGLGLMGWRRRRQEAVA